MAKEKTKIFISHAWKDKPLVKRLEKKLQAAGVETWVDDSRTRGGDNLPKRISDALEWCNALLLVWSDAATKSPWLELEWTNAIALHKNIIPCKKDKTQLPGILAHKLYIDFHDVRAGIEGLLNALDIEPPVEAKLIDKSQIQTQPKPKRKPKKEVTGVTAGTIQTPQIQLRSLPRQKLPVDDVKMMLKQRDFVDLCWNESGKGLEHQYEETELGGEKLVIDHTTGLTWQQSGSTEAIVFERAEAYIDQLNQDSYAGYSNWRLPTLDEAMSLVEPKKQSNSLYINPIFDKGQEWIWTSDKESASRAWFVGFHYGYCRHEVIDEIYYDVRAVR